MFSCVPVSPRMLLRATRRRDSGAGHEENQVCGGGNRADVRDGDHGRHRINIGCRQSDDCRVRSPQQLVDPGGAVVAAWTIGDLVPSADVVPYIPAGKLYETNAVIEADQGPATPLVANFNARTADGGSYRALATVPAPQGINPLAVPAGGKSTGKIYFDVTGANPNSVVYSDGAQDLLIWTAAPPPATPAPAAPAAPVQRRPRQLPLRPPPRNLLRCRPPRAACRPAATHLPVPPDSPARRREACRPEPPRQAATTSDVSGTPPAAQGPAPTRRVRRSR